MPTESEEHLSDVDTHIDEQLRQCSRTESSRHSEACSTTYQQVSAALRSISVTCAIRPLSSGAEIEDLVVDCVKERLQSNGRSILFSSSSPFNGLR